VSIIDIVMLILGGMLGYYAVGHFLVSGGQAA
jgi:hypothetical protein